MRWDRLSAIVAWNPEALAPVLAILALTIGFVAFYFMQASRKMQQRFAERYGEEEGQARWIIFARVFGGFTLGFPSVLFPMLFLDRSLKVWKSSVLLKESVARMEKLEPMWSLTIAVKSVKLGTRQRRTNLY